MTKKHFTLFVFCFLWAVLPLAGAEVLYNTPLPDDPLQARIYRLDNGLTVSLSINRETPSIQTYIGFRVGSLNDPADKTGLAHYLEHLLFKGSEQLGSTDFQAERPLLEKIEALYDRREASSDPEERDSIYREIDRLSYEAGQYTIQNEFVRSINEMGGTGLNAYTSLNRTVYLNTLPSNQLQKFLRLQFDRFKSPVFRGFHTELETVFEEYNLYQDQPGARFGKMRLEKMFPGHPLGRHPIGLPEHLKNPSPRRVMEFYRTNYVPENMVIVLAGDLDPAETLKWIEETFGTLPGKKAPDSQLPPLPPIQGESVYTMTTPENEMCYLLWRLDRLDMRRQDLLAMTADILSNGSAGLLDQNLNIPQKVASARAGYESMPGVFGILAMTAVPLPGSTPEEAKNLLDLEVEKLKKGEFPDWLPAAICDHNELNLIRSLKSNGFRANKLLDSFLERTAWPDEVAALSRQKKITKEEIVEFARNNLTADRLILYRKNGPLSPAEKLPKPPLTPLDNAGKGHSKFFEELRGMEIQEIQPEFPDLNGEIRRDELRFSQTLDFEGTKVETARRVPLQWIPNRRNEFFQLQLIFPVGSRNDRLWQLAGSYSSVAGTEKRSAEALKLELYRLAGSVSVSSGTEQTTLSISGLARNLPEMLKLADEMLAIPAVKPEALKLLTNKIELNRKTQKERPNAILFNGLLPLVQFGPEYMKRSNYTNEELGKLKAEDITALLKELKSYPARIQYYGPAAPDSITKLKKSIEELLPLPLPEKRPPTALEPEAQKIDAPAVYLVHVPNISQLHLLYLSRGGKYNPDDIGTRLLFNSYFGGGMSSVVFQALRESNSLAYNCFASYATPSSPTMPHWFYTYLSTQTDKLPDAVRAVSALGFPVKVPAVENSREALLKSQAAERWQDERLFSLSENFRTMGLPPDYREQTYRQLQDASVFDLIEFHRQEIKDKPRLLLVVGDAGAIDLKTLEQYAPVRRLTADEVFPY